MRTNELASIVEEEASIMEPENRSEQSTQNALYRVLQKLRSQKYVFTPTEKSAIKYALEDVGELYLFTGSSSGFDVENKKQEKEHQNRGSLARSQAYQLGIKLS